MEIQLPHSCTCGGPLLEEHPGESPHFFQCFCILCKMTFLAPKHEKAKAFLEQEQRDWHEMYEADRRKRMARNRRKRAAKRLAH